MRLITHAKKYHTASHNTASARDGYSTHSERVFEHSNACTTMEKDVTGVQCGEKYSSTRRKKSVLYSLHARVLCITL